MGGGGGFGQWYGDTCLNRICSMYVCTHALMSLSHRRDRHHPTPISVHLELIYPNANIYAHLALYLSPNRPNQALLGAGHPLPRLPLCIPVPTAMSDGSARQRCNRKYDAGRRTHRYPEGAPDVPGQRAGRSVFNTHERRCHFVVAIHTNRGGAYSRNTWG